MTPTANQKGNPQNGTIRRRRSSKAVLSPHNRGFYESTVPPTVYNEIPDYYTSHEITKVNHDCFVSILTHD